MYIALFFLASQMWYFSMHLPLMIGDKIPLDDLHWECYLLLLEITKYCTSKLTSFSMANYVKALIDQHHRDFKICYPAIQLTPKFHYMIHFPALLTQLVLF